MSEKEIGQYSDGATDRRIAALEAKLSEQFNLCISAMDVKFEARDLGMQAIQRQLDTFEKAHNTLVERVTDVVTRLDAHEYSDSMRESALSEAKQSLQNQLNSHTIAHNYLARRVKELTQQVNTRVDTVIRMFNILEVKMDGALDRLGSLRKRVEVMERHVVDIVARTSAMESKVYNLPDGYGIAHDPKPDPPSPPPPHAPEPQYVDFPTAMRAFADGKRVKRGGWKQWYCRALDNCIPVYADTVDATDWRIDE